METIDRNFEKDYLFGEQQEQLLLPILQNKFDIDLKLTDRYYKFDLVSNKYNIEIKSRKFKHDRYPTTLIPKNKCIIEDNKQTIFIINFIDRIYYIEYNKELFDKFKVVLFSRQQQYKYDLEYYFINLTYFTLLEIKKNIIECIC
jgi:hypothetical protein